MIKYKITIGSRVFDAESNGDGTFIIKNGEREFTMSAVALDVLEAKIEEVKEPQRVEYTFVLKENGCSNIRQMTPTFDITFLSKWIGKTVKVALTEVTEIIPDQCEHDYRNHDDSFYTCYQKCIKCGRVKK